MRSPSLPLLVLAAAATLTLSACGGSDSSGAGAMTSTGPDTTKTVSVSTIDGTGKILVDSSGAALYTDDQETGGKLVCSGSCTSVWLPLTLPAGDRAPSAASAALADKLGVVRRPDGAQQVTYSGQPLYRFAEDRSPGTVSGDGASDTFAGRHFTWHVATPSGVSSGSTSTAPSGGYGY
jgi:predicted lipoprotein with Yx(FWY)xxD motif